MAQRFDLIYGPPGAGKSRGLIELVKYMHKTTGKIARVYVGDGSGVMYSGSGLVEQGIISLVDFSIRDNPFTVCQQICEGWVPEDANNPQSKMRRLTPDEVTKTGLWIFEGAAVMGNYMMGDAKGGLAQRAADGEIIGQDANVRFTDTQGYAFGGNSPAHYGLGQRHLHANMMRTKSLPGWVIWTTHERMDDGERGGGLKGEGKVKLDDKTIGPELIGKALTANISRDFGNTLHFTTATKKVADGTDSITGKTLYKDKTEYRIYTRDHFDPDGIVGLKYRAVCRVSGDPSKVADYYVSDAPGQALLDFYTALAAANKLEV